jgi:hypothetical protein
VLARPVKKEMGGDGVALLNQCGGVGFGGRGGPDRLRGGCHATGEDVGDPAPTDGWRPSRPWLVVAG